MPACISDGVLPRLSGACLASVCVRLETGVGGPGTDSGRAAGATGDTARRLKIYMDTNLFSIFGVQN